MQSDCGVHGSLLRLGFLASFHPIAPSRKLSSLPYTGPPFGLPFLLVRVASSIILGNPLSPRPEILLGSFPSSTPAWMMLTVLLPSPPPPPALGYPSLSTLPWTILLPSSPAHQDVSKLLPLQPFTSTDPSCDPSSPLASPSATHILTQVAKTLRLDSATERRASSLQGTKELACLAPRDSSYLALHPILKNKSPPSPHLTS